MSIDIVYLILLSTIVGLSIIAVYIHVTVVVPTIKKYCVDEDMYAVIWLSDRIKRIDKFIKVSKEKDIHEKARIFIQFYYIVIAMLIVAFPIVMYIRM